MPQSNKEITFSKIQLGTREHWRDALLRVRGRPVGRPSKGSRRRPCAGPSRGRRRLRILMLISRIMAHAFCCESGQRASPMKHLLVLLFLARRPPAFGADRRDGRNLGPMHGTLYINVDQVGKIYLNGTKIAVAKGQHKTAIALSPGDRLVAKTTSGHTYRHLGMLFVSDDKHHGDQFSRRSFQAAARSGDHRFYGGPVQRFSQEGHSLQRAPRHRPAEGLVLGQDGVSRQERQRILLGRRQGPRLRRRRADHRRHVHAGPRSSRRAYEILLASSFFCWGAPLWPSRATSQAARSTSGSIARRQFSSTAKS